MRANESHNSNYIDHYVGKLNEILTESLASNESTTSPLRLMSSTLLANATENASNMFMNDGVISGTDYVDDDLLDYNVENGGGTATHLMSPDCMHYSGNITYLNVSCETILKYSVPLYGYCTPFLLLTTVTANTIIVLVLNKRNMATPTNLVLMGKR